MEKSEEKNNKKVNTIRWVIEISIISFILSIIFSYISTTAIDKISIIPAVLILLLVIVIGAVFDIVAMAVTIADENEFHAKATKKAPGAKKAIKLIRKAPKVSTICADVVGDICGVLSGTISAIIAVKIESAFGLKFNLEFIIAALVTSLTVASKAIGKEVAKKYSAKVVDIVAKILEGARYSKNK
jgi:CBS domain containing-hemolysin-like protein